MHPALSVIVFTTASGAGYGLLALLGLLAPLGLLPATFWFGAAALGLALGAITLGLLSSTAHLGRPGRAWRAMSQWRSSWLSREGLLALLTYLPAGLFALGWLRYASVTGPWAAAGLAAAALAVATVYCTGMIYASLKPIQRWHNGWVVPVYLLLALMTGALWLEALARPFGLSRPAFGWLAAGAILAALAAKCGYWLYIDRSRSRSTAGTATGLGRFGRVRLLEPPHTSENYLLKEMGFRIARKHAARLRRLALLLAFLAPLALTGAAMVLPYWPAAAASLLAALSATIGVLIERWLFFAEAKHAVTLYYGAELA